MQVQVKFKLAPFVVAVSYKDNTVPNYVYDPIPKASLKLGKA